MKAVLGEEQLAAVLGHRHGARYHGQVVRLGLAAGHHAGEEPLAVQVEPPGEVGGRIVAQPLAELEAPVVEGVICCGIPNPRPWRSETWRGPGRFGPRRNVTPGR